MAEFCNQCARKPDLALPEGDFAGLCAAAGAEWVWVLCEGCGEMIVVDNLGNRVDGETTEDTQ
jgi:hypothetical protein